MELSREAMLAWALKKTERRSSEEAEERRVVLKPPEAFSDEYAPPERLTRVRPGADPGATGPDSQTIRGLICGACAGWPEPPTSRELYEAMRVERLDDRQLSVVGVLISDHSGRRRPAGQSLRQSFAGRSGAGLQSAADAAVSTPACATRRPSAARRPPSRG